MPGLLALQPGEIFARDFRVVNKLSEGGMGAVYRVEQLSTGRQRALKLMHPELVGNPGLRAKFEQEARIGARIQSDHVVEVVAAGVDAESGAPYLAMELLVGADLAETVKRRGPMPWAETVGVMGQLCDAVGAAHAASIVHRDLKPENVFLRQARAAGAPPTVKVLDFGIAKVVEEAKTTNTGAMGTPHWMAPEQTERRAAITPAADVWALGLIAFYLLTGRYFWRAANEDDTSLTALMREVVLEHIPPASVRAGELGAPPGRLPPGFDAWFGKCVVREAPARYPDARIAYEGLLDATGTPRAGAPSSGRIDSGSGAQLPPSGGVVVTGPARAFTPQDLGSAHTVRDASALVPDDEPVGKVPVGRSPIAIFAVAGVIALGGVAGLLLMLRHDGGDAPPPPPPADAGAGVRELLCPDGMAAVTGGTFRMGSEDGDSDERPVHAVTLNAFCMDLSEVTVQAYAACVAAGACRAAATTVAWKGVQPKDHAVWDAYCNTGKADRQSHPQNCVTWGEARVYCKYAGKRLPTEEEWEYAARGADDRTYPWGGEAPSAERLNACGPECATKGSVLGLPWKALYPATDHFDGTAPVRSFPAGRSPFGLFDMAGNVSEWTASASCPYPGNNCSSDYRTTRGASFATDEERDVRSSDRGKDAPSARIADVGFRCVK